MWGRVGNQRLLASPYNAISVAMAQWTVSLAHIFLKMKMVPLWQSTLNVTFTCLTLSCVHKWKDVYTTCKMFIFNRMVPPYTLHDCQWTWFVACFQEGSFHVSATSCGPQGPLIWPLVTFFCGDTSNHMSILTNLAPCPIWRRQSGEEAATIDREMLERVYADFKKVDTTCLTLSFIHNMQFKWHVIMKIFL